MAVRELRDLTLTKGELYFRDSGGVLARAVSKVEAKEELQRVCDLSY